MIQLTITVQDDGRTRVDGPVDDKILCYGLLEAAKDAVRDHVAAKARRVQPVILVPKLNGGLEP